MSCKECKECRVQLIQIAKKVELLEDLMGNMFDYSADYMKYQLLFRDKQTISDIHGGRTGYISDDTTKPLYKKLDELKIKLFPVKK